MKALSYVFFLSFLVLVGCTSTSHRISANPDAFNSLSAESKALVRKGEVKLGLSEEAVRLALGEPDRVEQKEMEKGTIWAYTDLTDWNAQEATRTIHFKVEEPEKIYETSEFASDMRKADKLRVVIKDGKVQSIAKAHKTLSPASESMKNELSLGASEADVRRRLGKPDRIEQREGRTVLRYTDLIDWDPQEPTQTIYYKVTEAGRSYDRAELAHGSSRFADKTRITLENGMVIAIEKADF